VSISGNYRTISRVQNGNKPFNCFDYKLIVFKYKSFEAGLQIFSGRMSHANDSPAPHELGWPDRGGSKDSFFRKEG
jgi:hypothetical protein